MILVKAELVTIRRDKPCAVCGANLEKNSFIWREIWDDLDKVIVKCVHVQCQSEMRTREEQRADLVKNLASNLG